MTERKYLYENEYIGLFDDGTIGISDGVGFIDEMSKEEVVKLYDALKKLFRRC